jgi:hypothetical protein
MPGTNFFAQLTKAMRKYYNGADISAQTAGVPLLPNNEPLQALNAAGTALVDVVKVDANNRILASNPFRFASGVCAFNNIARTTSVTTSAVEDVLAYTAAMVLGGLILRDPNGAARADTLPTAAALVAAIPGAVVGDSVEFVIRNTANGAETITVTAPDAAVTISGTPTIAQNASTRWLAVLTNVTAAAQAYTCYNVGAFTH